MCRVQRGPAPDKAKEESRDGEAWAQEEGAQAQQGQPRQSAQQLIFRLLSPGVGEASVTRDALREDGFTGGGVVWVLRLDSSPDGRSSSG